MCVKQHRQRLVQLVRSHRAAPQAALIAHLNPVIRGWCRYYSTQVSKRCSIRHPPKLGAQKASEETSAMGQWQVLARYRQRPVGLCR